MLANQTSEIIARFIGLFDIVDENTTADRSYSPFDHASNDVEPGNVDARFTPAAKAGIDARPYDPDIDLDPYPFSIESVVSTNVSMEKGHGGEKIEIDDRFLRTNHLPPSFTATSSSTTAPNGQPSDLLLEYREAGIGSTLSLTTQTTFLDDADVLWMGTSASVTGTPTQVTDQFDQVLTALNEFVTDHSRFETPTEGRSYQDTLGTSAATRTDVGRLEDGAPFGHDGTYVDGVRAVDAPDLASQLVRGPGPEGDFASLGRNTLLNEATVVSLQTLAGATVVLGDWHETNSIRQVNVLIDVDRGPAGVVAHGTGGDHSYNAATFERIDLSRDASSATPMASFPANYLVDVVEGDLVVTSFLRQLHLTIDGDQVVLSATSHDATVILGGNQAVALSSLFLRSSGYDLVVIGGHVFEANFVEQINLLSDSDRLSFATDGASSHTSGNLAINQATIVNYGAVDGFDEVSPQMRALVSAFDARAPSGDFTMAQDLAFLQGTGLRVLYVTGNQYELTVVSQMNVLADNDEAHLADAWIEAFVASAGPEATWTVETGGNHLVNVATIVDFDGAERFLGGEYYSDSFLLQAEMVAPDDDVRFFDVDLLVPELVAFTTASEAPVGQDADGYSPSHQTSSSHDGVASVLA